MVASEERIINAGAQIIWVLEADGLGIPGTMQSCADFMTDKGSTHGWCVGDGQTSPDKGEWDTSPFSIGRGFDIIVPRASMSIEYTTNHGTPSGNENISGADVAAKVEEIIAGLP